MSPRMVRPGQKAAFDDALAHVGCPDRRIDRFCITCCDAAESGLGVTRVLSYQVAKSVVDRSLRLILEDFEPEKIPVSVLHREDRLPQVKVQSFMAFAISRLRKALSADRR